MIRGISVALGLLTVAALAGCRSEAEEARAKSNATHQFGVLGRMWNRASATLASEKPELNLIRMVNTQMETTHLRAQLDYPGPNKAQVLKGLRDLMEMYKVQVLSLVDLAPPQVQLRPGESLDKLRAAFAPAFKKYKELEAALVK